MKRCALLVTVLLVAAQIGAHDPVAAQSEPGVLQQVDGTRWSVEYISTTPEDDSGEPCSNGRGKVRIMENIVAGTVLGTNRRIYRISGEIHEDGTIEAGLAISDVTFARFTGTQSADHAIGTWEAKSGCRGTWSSTPYEGNEVRFNSLRPS